MHPRSSSESSQGSAFQRIKKWLEDYGFGALVLIAIAAAASIAHQAQIPTPIPNFALKSVSLYRVEIGGACFFVFYLAVLAFVLALNGRGFTSIGPRGVKADQVVRANQVQQQTLKGQEQSIEALERNLERNRIATTLLNRQNQELREKVAEVSKRLESLEDR